MRSVINTARAPGDASLRTLCALPAKKEVSHEIPHYSSIWPKEISSWVIKPFVCVGAWAQSKHKTSKL